MCREPLPLVAREECRWQTGGSEKPSLKSRRIAPRLGTEMQATVDRSLLPELKRLAHSVPQTGDALRATLSLEKAAL
jgi:hypothetical protein